MAERKVERLSQLVKVELTSSESFVQIKALLKRVGINPKGSKKLFQTCHILRDGNDFYICHFKELFWLDGKENRMDELDIQRRNRIICLLSEKKLIKADLTNLTFSKKASNSVFIVPYSQTENYTLHPKYRFKKLKRIEPDNGAIN